jgi:hypothetical protein
MYIVVQKKQKPIANVDDEETAVVTKEGFALFGLEIPMWVLGLVIGLIVLSIVGIYFALTYSKSEPASAAASTPAPAPAPASVIPPPATPAGVAPPPAPKKVKGKAKPKKTSKPKKK